MADTLFEGKTSLRVQAMYIGQRIDLRSFEHTTALSTLPLTISAGENGLVVLFRYGVVVFFGMHASEIIGFRKDIQSLVIDPFSDPEHDEIGLIVNTNEAEGVEQGRIRLQALNLQRLQIVADVLAKSVILAHYEINLARHFDRIEPLAASLRQQGLPGPKGRELLLHIGDILMIEAKMIGRVEVTEKPELIWDYPEYERLYARLEDEFELTERHTALDRKLALLSKTAETLLGILQNKRSLRVEWYIVILIMVDIVISISDKFM